MRQVGNRIERQMVARASGALLAEGGRFNETVARFSNISYIPKGVYRFASHLEANAHDQDCLVSAMAALALARKNG